MARTHIYGNVRSIISLTERRKLARHTAHTPPGRAYELFSVCHRFESKQLKRFYRFRYPLCIEQIIENMVETNLMFLFDARLHGRCGGAHVIAGRPSQLNRMVRTNETQPDRAQGERIERKQKTIKRCYYFSVD